MYNSLYKNSSYIVKHFKKRFVGEIKNRGQEFHVRIFRSNFYSPLSAPQFIPWSAMWKLQGGFRSVESSDGNHLGTFRPVATRRESEYVTPLPLLKYRQC